MKKPTIPEIQRYIDFKCLGRYVDAERFYWHYESNGWKVGKNPMKKWRAAVSGWAARERHNQPHKIERKCAYCDDKATGLYDTIWHCTKESCRKKAMMREGA